MSVDSGPHYYHDGVFPDSIAQFDQKSLTKNADDPSFSRDVICDVT